MQVFFLRVSLFFLQAVCIFFFFQRALYDFTSETFFHRTKEVAWMCSVKTLPEASWKIYQKTLSLESFLSVKLQDRDLQLYLKKIPAQEKNFKNTYFVEHLQR